MFREKKMHLYLSVQPIVNPTIVIVFVFVIVVVIIIGRTERYMSAFF